MAQLYRFLGRERVDHIESQKGIGKPKKAHTHEPHPWNQSLQAFA